MNLTVKEHKSIGKKSVSPLTKGPVSPLAKVSVTPITKKIEIKQSKSPSRVSYNSTKQPNVKKVKPFDLTSKIQKLFRHLTKCNPGNLSILSPEYINLKGMDRNLLSDLQ